MTDEELTKKVAHVLCETGAAASWVHAVQSARHLLLIIKAERIRGGEMVKEAAGIAAQGTWAEERIRALSVPAIVEAGDGDL